MPINRVTIKAAMIMIILAAMSVPAFPEEKYSISGSLSDKESAQPLAGCSVFLERTPYGTVADRNGHYLLKNIPAGHYNLLVSMMGYKIVSKQIDLRADMKEVNFELEEKALQTGEIVVSANKRIQAVQDVPISMAVIDSRAVFQRSAVRLDKLIEFVPGVEVNKDNISIRGTSGFAYGVGSRTAVLMDGFPVLSGDNGDVKFDVMPLFDVERIEIVKGSGSALYGSSALGGVINIISREPTEKAETKFRIYGGLYTRPRYKQWDYSNSLHGNSGAEAGFSGRFGRLGMILTAGWHANESWRQYDDSKRYNLYSRFSYNFSDRTDALISISAANENKTDWIYWHGLDSATFPAAGTDYDRRIDSRKLTIISQIKHIFNDRFFAIAKAGYFGTNYANNLPESNPEKRESDAGTYSGEVQGNYRIAASTLITTGLFLQHNEVTSFTYGNREQNIFAAYLQGELNFPENLTVTAGSRIDYEKALGIDGRSEVSPKFGITYKPSGQLSFRASAGSGFRAPTVAERYATAEYQGLRVKENTALLPETGWSFEVGGNYEGLVAGLPLYADIALFRNDLKNLIEPSFLSDNSGTIQFMNVTKARILGIEGGVKAMLFGFVGLETSLTLMDPKDLTLGETLKYRSEVLWYNKLSLNFGTYEFQCDYRYKSRQKNIDEKLGLQIKDADARVAVHLVDARAIIRLEPLINLPIQVSLNAFNLFDYYYTEVPGNLAATRNLTLQIEGGF